MPTPRIHHVQPLRAGDRIELSPTASQHAVKVLRLQTGAALVLFDGSGRDFPAVIAAITRDRITAEVGDPVAVDVESPARITLLQGVCRGARMDVVLQKATELGVAAIRPVLTHRSVVRLDAAERARKREHWQRIVISACEQCGRSRVPDLAAPAPLTEVFPSLDSGDLRLLLDPTATIGPAGLPAGGDAGITLLIGPEGGLTDAERALAIDHGFAPLRLGPRILRTETAPLAALAVLQHLRGDLR